ncbi:Uncharacterised protein [Burkholderia pseudomallei]|uniref:hypothetical protein n=1 Tax=Burkholderia pseudomallei TaxID=28450 RepID=UPI0009782269|nr:hypothetical protein [Burkholderia pseudomallei]NAY04713.1 hypothetical protein [Burkholderia pseudomallei]NAY12315.1 hypothetical protein [Burkholderia pseudomallei]NAY38465.1 hypothetical protein [Burkholderia pseudomallei]NAY43810.1 hypothetical protein [Burkholderia pseudomallei]NAY50294.1 hypothetical protein [Burkholderia pseudomallei]
MAQRHDASFFDRLIAPMLRHLRHIARLTQGEHTVDDLKSEAWIIAEEIKAERGSAIEPDDADLQESVVARLHKMFGRFVNRAMRFATRLDQEDRDDDGDLRENSVAARVAGPAHYEPHAAFEHNQEIEETALVIASQFSEAVAYFHMFDQFDGDSAALATYFAIKARTLRTRLRRAENTARDQPSVFDRVAAIPPDFMAARGTWARQPAFNQFRRICGSARPAQLHLFLQFGKVFGPTARRYGGRTAVKAIWKPPV